MARITISLIAATALACVVLTGSARELVAQSGPAPNVVKNAPRAAPAGKPEVPSDDKLLMLICSTLLALNQANATGNYSVFRELAAPGFQIGNSTGQLSETFAEFRNHHFDLSPIVLLQPKLVRKPEIDQRGMLRISGFFSTEPDRVNFDLMYQFLDGQWRLFGIAANTTPETPTAGPAQSKEASQSSAAPPAKAGPLKGKTPSSP